MGSSPPPRRPLVWVHGEALGPANPALRAHPDAPAVFVWDGELIAGRTATTGGQACTAATNGSAMGNPKRPHSMAAVRGVVGVSLGRQKKARAISPPTPPTKIWPLASGQTLAQAVASLGHVAEGVYSARTVLQRAQTLGVDMPIVAAVVDLLDGRTQPAQAVAALMGRGAKAELA